MFQIQESELQEDVRWWEVLGLRTVSDFTRRCHFWEQLALFPGSHLTCFAQGSPGGHVPAYVRQVLVSSLPADFIVFSHLVVKFPLSSCCQRVMTPLFVPPPPPPSRRLSASSGSLNYSAEYRCSAVRRWSTDQPDSVMAGGERAGGVAEWWQQMSVWELSRKPHTRLPQPPLLPIWQLESHNPVYNELSHHANWP